MLFIDNNGNYPRYLGDLREAHPSWTFKNAIPAGWIVVRETTAPEVSGLEMLVELYPEEINGVFTQKWTVELMPQEVTETEVPQTVMQRFGNDPKLPV